MSDDQYLYYRKNDNTYNRWQRCRIDDTDTLSQLKANALYETYQSELYKLVIYYNVSWSDEFYLNDKIIMSFNSWYEFIEHLERNSTVETEVYFGTNESQLITANDFKYIETRAIFNGHAKVITDYNMETNMVLLEAIIRLEGNEY